MSAATNDDVLALATAGEHLEQRFAALAGEVIQRAEDQAAKLELLEAKLDEVLEVLGPLCATVATMAQTMATVEQLAAAVGPLFADPAGPMRMFAGMLGGGGRQ